MDPRRITRLLLEGLPPLQRRRFTLRARETVRLPPWTGSTLHGAIGHGLMRIACNERCRELHATGAPASCPYAILFQGPEPAPDLPGRLRDTHAPALVLVPPPPGRERALSRGDRFELEAVLLGRAVDLAGLLAAAVERAAESGLGYGRGRLALESFTLVDPVGPASRSVSPGPIRVVAVTPLRLVRKHPPGWGQKRLVSKPSFEDLASAAVFRLSAVAAHHGGAITDIEAGDIAVAAADVTCSEATWQRVSYARVSTRQNQRYEADGIVGHAVLEGPASEWVSLLVTAGALGVGKNPSFGFGQLRVESPRATEQG